MTRLIVLSMLALTGMAATCYALCRRASTANTVALVHCPSQEAQSPSPPADGEDAGARALAALESLSLAASEQGDASDGPSALAPVPAIAPIASTKPAPSAPALRTRHAPVAQAVARSGARDGEREQEEHLRAELEAVRERFEAQREEMEETLRDQLAELHERLVELQEQRSEAWLVHGRQQAERGERSRSESQRIRADVERALEGALREVHDAGPKARAAIEKALAEMHASGVEIRSAGDAFDWTEEFGGKLGAELQEQLADLGQRLSVHAEELPSVEEGFHAAVRAAFDCEEECEVACEEDCDDDCDEACEEACRTTCTQQPAAVAVAPRSLTMQGLGGGVAGVGPKGGKVKVYSLGYNGDPLTLRVSDAPQVFDESGVHAWRRIPAAPPAPSAPPLAPAPPSPRASMLRVPPPSAPMADEALSELHDLVREMREDVRGLRDELRELRQEVARIPRRELR